MDMPSRIQIRHWLETLTRDEILANLEKIRVEHGPEDEQDVRDFLNLEREAFKQTTFLNTPSENSILSEHEEWKRQVQDDIEFKKKLYRDSQ